jgi:hypothetical protein
MEKELKITTNKIYRDLLSFCELPAKMQKHFDYVDIEDYDSYRFFKYKDIYYDTNQFIPCSTAMFGKLKKWDSYKNDSFYSGIVINYSTEFDTVLVGTYIY